MSILDKSIWYYRENDKIIMQDDVYTELVYIVHKLEKENQRLKKQKDDVVELINYYGITPEQNDNTILRHILKDILRMLGEIE